MAEKKAAYTTDHSQGVMQTHSWRSVENSAEYLIPFLRPDMTILDIGCGPGSITIGLAKLVPQGRVIGIDYVDDPLQQARESAAAAEGVNNVTFQVGNIGALDFPDDHFDVCHVHQVLQHVAEPVKALSEMRRVVKKPGGLVAARESASMTCYPNSPRIEAWDQIYERISRARGLNPHPGSYIHVWAVQAGFERADVTCSTGSWCFGSPEERAYWGGTMAERALSSSGMAKTAVDEGYATREELEHIAQAWREWVKDEEGWFGVLHGQIVCRG